MSTVQLHIVQDIDLNLIPVLRVLLEEENVTRAAKRLHLSVPATSRALERARVTFGDPLLVRQGRGVVMTPTARRLLPGLDRAVGAIEAVLDRPERFDPGSIRESFVIRSSEAVIAAIGSPLLAVLGDEAPHAELRFETEGADDLAAIQSGKVSLGIGNYSEGAKDIESEFLLTEPLVGVLRAGHPALRRRVSLATFAALDHVVVSRKGSRRNPLDKYLAEHGLTRNVVAVVPSFSAALAMAATSDVTTISPHRLAATFAGNGGLGLFAVPTPTTQVDIHQIWHLRFTRDPTHTWFRSCVQRAAAALPPIARSVGTA